VIEILQRIGIKSGQSVLDFGCGSGTYTIPVAKIVGKQGKVYALDKDKNELDNLMKKARGSISKTGWPSARNSGRSWYKRLTPKGSNASSKTARGSTGCG